MLWPVALAGCVITLRLQYHPARPSVGQSNDRFLCSVHKELFLLSTLQLSWSKILKYSNFPELENAVLASDEVLNSQINKLNFMDFISFFTIMQLSVFWMYIYGVTSLMKCLLDEHAVGLYSVFYAILPLVRQRYILLQTTERPYSHNSLCWFRNISIIWTETVKTFRQHTQTFIISLYITIKQICGEIIKKLPHVLCYSTGTLHWQCFKL